MWYAHQEFYLLGLILLSINFISKLWVRQAAYNYAEDTYTHLYITRVIRDLKAVPKYLPGFLFDEYYGAQFNYPFLLHAILACFPIHLTERAERLIGPFINTIDILIIYVFSTILSGSLTVSFVIACIYSIAPIIFETVLYLTPRVFGILFINIALSSIIFYDLNPHPIFLGIFAVVGIGIFLLHKFTTQTFIIGTLFIIIAAEHKVEILFTFGLVLLFLAIPLYSIYVKRIFDDHIAVIKWHFHNPKINEVHIIRSILSEIWNSPMLPCLIIFSILGPDFFFSFLINKLMLAWVTGCFLASWLTTYIKWLRPFGEGYRYKEYAVFPLAYLIVAYWNYNLDIWTSTLLAVVCLLSLLAIIRKSMKLIRNEYRSRVDLITLCIELRTAPKDNIWALGYGIAPFVLYKTGKKILGGLNISKLLNEPDWYPVLKKPYSYFINKFDVTYLIVDDQYLDINQLEIVPKREITVIGHYHLFEIIR